MTITSGPWRSPTVTVAASFKARLVGLRGNTTNGLLLRTRSVYLPSGMGPLRIIHINREGGVVRQDILTTGRRVSATSEWTLELPIQQPGPACGARLTVLPSSGS